MGQLDELIGESAIAELGSVLSATSPTLEWRSLYAARFELAGLSLSARARSISATLRQIVDDDYTLAADIYRRALADSRFTGWPLWAVTESAAELAVIAGAEAVEDCFELLADLTPRFTGEYAFRLLLASDLDRGLSIARGWTAHHDEHVRRLASEGTRPYLPWAMRIPGLTERSEAACEILHALRNDESGYVRRSVANHLNDLSRDAPSQAMKLAKLWLAKPDPNTRRLVTHGLRTLIKNGNSEALSLLGFEQVDVTVDAPTLSVSTVRIPGLVIIRSRVHNNAEERVNLVIDYVVYYRKANGELRPKVFKLTTMILGARESRSISTTHSFRQMTTRTHYPGVHRICIQVNGQPSASTELMVETTGAL